MQGCTNLQFVKKHKSANLSQVRYACTLKPPCCEEAQTLWGGRRKGRQGAPETRGPPSPGRSPWVLAAPSHWVAPAEAPADREQKQAVSTVPCPNSCPTGMSLGNHCFMPLSLQGLFSITAHKNAVGGGESFKPQTYVWAGEVPASSHSPADSSMSSKSHPGP